MHRSSLLRLIALLSLLATEPSASDSPGLSRPKAQESHELVLSVRVIDGVASTRLHQVMRNETDRPSEAIWVLPLPEGAVADAFTMTVNGVLVPDALLTVSVWEPVEMTSGA